MKYFRINRHLLFSSKTKVLVLILVFLILGTYIYKNFNRDHLSLFIKSSNCNCVRTRPEDKILFMHIAKSGGSSIISHFKKFYPSYYEPHLRKKDQCIIDCSLFVRSHVKRIELENFNLLHTKKFIFFRDPKERILSLYYYSKVHGNPPMPQDMDLRKFLQPAWKRHPSSLSNYYAYMYNNYLTYLVNREIKESEVKDDVSEKDIEDAISYLKTFDFIGFTENFDEDFKLLSDMYSIPRPEGSIKDNSFEINSEIYKKREGKDLIKEAITPEIDRELDRLTKYDYIIYNAAKKISKEKREKWRAQRKLEGFAQ